MSGSPFRFDRDRGLVSMETPEGRVVVGLWLSERKFPAAEVWLEGSRVATLVVDWDGEVLVGPPDGLVSPSIGEDMRAVGDDAERVLNAFEKAGGISSAVRRALEASRARA